MKFFKLIIFVLAVVAMGGKSFAQTGGVEPIFQNDKLTISNKVEIYPNPTTEFINIQITKSNLKEVKFYLYNIIGNEMRVNLENLGDDNYRIDVRDVPQGYYLLSIKDDKTHFRQTFKVKVDN
ncbi:MAG: T9SS type A sorting domain-containing protein [Bacteroidota bacterium]